MPLIHGAGDPGLIELADAVALDYGLLVALGDRGLRLLTYDGRLRGRWDTPAHALCVADHGASALVLTVAESTVDIHRLDLDRRRLQHRATLRGTYPLESFDGSVMTIVDSAGIAGIDITVDPPRELWRDLVGVTSVVTLTRGPTAMSACVVAPLQLRPHEPSYELWTWDLPSRRLSRRELFDEPWPSGVRVTASGTVLPNPAVVSADVAGVFEPATGRFAIRRVGNAIADVEFPAGDGTCLRAHADTITAFTPDGRIVVISTATRGVLANLTVHV